MYCLKVEINIFFKFGLNELEQHLNNKLFLVSSLLRLFYFLNNNLQEFMRFHIFFGSKWYLNEIF
jgi:hypothetical protein